MYPFHPLDPLGLLGRWGLLCPLNRLCLWGLFHPLDRLYPLCLKGR